MDTPNEKSSTFVTEDGTLIFISETATYTVTGSCLEEKADGPSVFFKGHIIS